MALYYHERNLKNIEKLADHTKEAAMKWHNYLVENDIDILIYETIRIEAQQKENVRKGVSQTIKSYHLVGQALDFVPVDGARTDWNGYMKPDIQKAVKEAKRLGFEWGGDWKKFIDRPHLQFNHKGYGTDTFGKYTPKVTMAKKEEPKKVIINNKEDEEMFNPSNNALKEAVSVMLLRLSEKEVHGDQAIDPEWRNKFNRGELSVSDGLALIFTTAYRGMWDKHDGSDE